jgi:hypothetical protein
MSRIGGGDKLLSVQIEPGHAMRRNMWITAFALASLLLIAGEATALAAGSEADFKAAYAAAEAANKEAGQLRDQWTTTATALAEAKKSADGGDFDRAIALSKQAEALAKASIFQASSEREAWKNSEIQ